MIALVVLLNIDLEVPFVGLFIVDVLVDAPQYILLLALNFIIQSNDLISEHLKGIQAGPWPFKDDLGDKHISATHKLLVLLHLCLDQTWEDFLGHCKSTGRGIDEGLRELLVRLVTKLV